MLGAEPLAVAIGRKTFALGFPLRAALRLARSYPNPLDLLQAIAECNTSAMAQIISECSSARYSPEQLFDDLAPANRGMQLRALAGMLSGHVVALFSDGLDLEKPRYQGTPTKIPARAEKPDIAKGYESLFSVATGTLGWSPEVAWSASPSEIIAASKGRGELIRDILKAVFGSADDEPDNTPALDNSVFDREGLQALKGMGKW